jgi:hypothetical protein
MSYYKIKYDKYLTKLENTNNIKYYFNSYGKIVPERYYMFLNLINQKRANIYEYSYIKNNAIQLAKNDYNARCNLIIGSYNMIISFYTEDSVLNFVLRNNNTCYIETFCGFSTVLLNLLKELCYQYGIKYIITFTHHQELVDFLLHNSFIFDKNKYLVFNFS